MRPIKLTQKLFSLPEGGEERFHGFGIMGLTFESGHILALRHFPASSIGKGYTSVWHRRPDGTWDFYADVDPEISCTRYFSDEVSGIFIEPINIKWIGNDYLRVEIKAADLNWIIRIESNFTTRIMNFCCRIIPDKWWKNKKILRLMGKFAGWFLQAGRIILSGKVPNHQHFVANPYRMWMVTESKANLEGKDLGRIGPLKEQAHLEDFWIPQKGILAMGKTYFDLYDPQTHLEPSMKKTELF